MLLTTTPTVEGRKILEYKALGANAIVGIDIDYETIGQSGSMLMVAVSGTAVLI